MIALLGVVATFYQLEQTKDALAIQAISNWNASNKAYSKSCIEFLVKSEKEQADKVLAKESVILAPHQVEALYALRRCLYTNVGNPSLFSQKSNTLTSIGSTYVAGTITASMNSFNDAIKMKYSNAANPSIIDDAFKSTVSTCLFRKAIVRIHRDPDNRTALKSITKYIEELRKGYDAFPRDCP